MRSKRRDPSSVTNLFDSETGSYRKKWKDKLPVALVFPNSYFLGMSNLGFQLVYALLNSYDQIVCERIFHEPGVTPHSVESNRLLKDFPVVMFSVSFEQDFVNVPGLLTAGGVEPFSQKRIENDENISPESPLVICGGVATFINPEPLAPFVDLFMIGEFEPVAQKFVEYLLRVNSHTKQSFLKKISSLQGAYVPSFFLPQYKQSGEIENVKVIGGFPERIKKVHCENKDIAGYSEILSPETEFSQIHLVELGRGCSRSCRFCAAGYVYRKPRLWSPESVVKAVSQRPSCTDRVGLLGMEMAKPEDLRTISKLLLDENCSLSFSSLRADMIKGPLLDLIKASNLKTAVIAPDGGSERLRRVINKGITAQDCLSSASSLIESGIATLKMYFMIGLPTEEDSDLDELIGLVQDIQNVINKIGRKKGRLSQINLSVNSFVPKAWTPFQYHPFESVNTLKRKIKFLRKNFAKFNNLKLTVDNPDSAYFQAVLARGDRRVGMLLPQIYKQPKSWIKILNNHGLDPDFYASRQRENAELFPWDVIDHGLNKEYLWKEYQLALDGQISSTCGAGISSRKCRKCGVCND